MKKRKTLQDLTIKDNFLFGAVMHVEENSKGFLELVLSFPIAHVVVSKERSMIYHPEYKGVRLDIYAEDENHTHYNVEMQMRRKKALGKRSRYYHSQIVMEALESGEEYETIPDTFVIFVCDFDPFGKELYCYTFQNECKEDRDVKLEDGCCTIFLSTQGKKEELVSPDLVRLLKFVMADLEESEGDFGDELVERFQKTIREIKADREMGGRYMIFEEMLREEKQEGKVPEDHSRNQGRSGNGRTLYDFRRDAAGGKARRKDRGSYRSNTRSCFGASGRFGRDSKRAAGENRRSGRSWKT